MKVAVVGATGLVGRKMLQVLEEKKLPGNRVNTGSQRAFGRQRNLLQGEKLQSHGYAGRNQHETSTCYFLCRRRHFTRMRHLTSPRPVSPW